MAIPPILKLHSIQPTCFVTFSGYDKEFFRKLVDDLIANGVGGFFDFPGLSDDTSLPVPYYFVEGIQRCDVYLPILSFNSLRSHRCNVEIRIAIALTRYPRGNEHPRVIPILVENCQSDMLEELRSYPSVNFTGRYRSALKELLRIGFGISITLSEENGFDFLSVFISHSAKDKPFCERLYADLQAKGVRVWYFPEDARWGEPVWGEIDRSIKVYDRLIVVCSENSLQSGPVNREIERALNREDKETKGILFPIRIDDYIFDHWDHERKADVVRKVVGDFSGWDKDAAKYDKAFDKLLKGLQAES